jgi:hypothetical protein
MDHRYKKDTQNPAAKPSARTQERVSQLDSPVTRGSTAGHVRDGPEPSDDTLDAFTKGFDDLDVMKSGLITAELNSMKSQFLTLIDILEGLVRNNGQLWIAQSGINHLIARISSRHRIILKLASFQYCEVSAIRTPRSYKHKRTPLDCSSANL